MDLLTKKLVAAFAEIGSQRAVKDPLVICKFDTLGTAFTRCATEYDPETGLFYGCALYIEELDRMEVPLKMFQRPEKRLDASFAPTPLSGILQTYGFEKRKTGRYRVVH